MLEILNRYAHGIASIPVLHALDGRGCLSFMEEAGTFSAAELTHRFSANRAYIDVALRMFVSLGWIRPAADGRHEATPALANRNAIPGRIMELYLFPFEEHAAGNEATSLAEWVELSRRRWNSDDPYLPDFLDGLLIVPLLLALRAQGRLHVEERTDGATLRIDASTAVRDELGALFVARGWAETDGGELRLHLAGKFIVDRIFITATAASYRPMFARAQELLFGDPAQVFAHDLEGHETHLDRTLNVVGSGFQHEKYFEALSEIVVASFDHEDYASQPDFLVDTGCGDGTLLRRLYETVRDRTARGRVLDRHPLRLIAVDYNEKALAAAAKTLHDLDALTLHGDIGDPSALAGSLRANGVTDLARVLHVRSFLDHDRPYIPPADLEAAQRRPLFGEGIFVDRFGSPIPAAELVQSTVEHLRRWAELVNGHGLVLLEVHSLPAEVTARYLDESENFHFDAYHSMSRQYLLEAETFALCAAEAGLFCRDGAWRRFPRHLPFTRITLAHFEKKPYSVRHARRGELASLTGAFPEGALVLEVDGRIAAAVSCTPEGDAIRVTSAYVQPGLEEAHAGGLLRFVTHYWALKPGAGPLIGIDEARGAMLAAAAEVSSQAQSVAREVAIGVAAYPFAVENDPREAERVLGTFSFRWLLANLQRMGAMRRAGESYELDELKRRLGVASKYDRYFDALLRRLAVEGLVALNGRRMETTPLVESYALTDVDRQVAEFEESFRQSHPACAALFNFTASCLRRYEDIVTGQIPAADVLFADGGTDVFAEVFRGDPVSDYFNRIVADAARAVAARAGGKRKVRILEIGAGTGGTTTAVLEALEPFAGSVEYWFTDISLSFARAARRRFSERYPWIEYQSLNIEEDLAAQGFDRQSFDVVIAANVLHDTRDIDFTLRQTHALLRAGGLLVLNEYTSVKDCLSFSGALLHGWWLFEDPERRLNDNCLLSVPLWTKVFERTNFALAGAFALPTQRVDEECSQSVMLCESLGEGQTMTEERSAAAASRTVAGTRAVDAVPTRGRIGKLVEQDILTLLGARRAPAYTAALPLMTMGLDSIELVELRTLLERRFGVKLTPMFLFDNETPQKMAAALERMLPDEQLRALPADDVEASPATPAVEDLPGGDAIAVVGIACRFPGGVDSADAFWSFLDRGGDAVGSLPAGRFRWPASIEVDGKHKGIDRGGFLERIDQFDAQFFRTSAAEAELMDPQQRLLLELSWEAMEDAGHRPSELAGRRTGVFAGVCHNDYRELLAAAADTAAAYAGSGGATSMLANRISYFYDFHGPSITVDTACSSALSALHEAVAAMRRGDCEQALVGAVNLICTPTNSISYYRAGMLSPTGTCRALDATADGFVRGEGGAVLLLRPLAAALADGDSIYGLVQGTAVNHGGQAASLTAPKPESQAAVVEAAWRAAGGAPESAGYIELHGTGTRLGDPVEVGGLAAAFRRLSATSDFRCGLGAVKTNVGHLEGAAGMAGVIKVLLAMQHRRIPGSLHFERLNPDIDLAGTPFYVVAQNQEWAAARDGRGRELQRRAGVSSFGFGGANAHVVLGEYRTPQRATGSGAPRYVVPLSAKNRERLHEQASRLLNGLKTTEASLREIAYTLQVGREPMPERVAFVVESRQELADALQAYVAGVTTIPNCHRGNAEQQADAEAIDILASRDLPSLAAAWSEGADVDWARLYPNDRPQRVHLPAYPFARESYWVPQPAELRAETARLHPLVHENTSDLGEQRYRTVFTGQELFLADSKQLPSAAYLEMAREAVARSVAQTDAGEGASRDVLELRDFAWLRPVTFGAEPVEVQIALSTGDSGGIAFEIYGDSGAEGEVVYARGTAITGVRAEMPRVDVAALPGASRVSLPAPLASTGGQFVLHPSVLEAALQAAGAASVALNSMEIHRPTPSSGWVTAERNADRWNVELYDDEGRVAVRLRGLSTQRPGGRRAGDVVSADADALRREVQADLARVVSHLLILPPDRFRPDADFHALGFDSISYTVFADQLNETYGLELTPTVFYEHSTLERFTRHLVERHRDVLAAHYGVPLAAVVSAEERKPERRVRRPRVAATPVAAKPEPIAIVGMSGRFPMAKDIDELWANLVSGRDCIGEIPPERWDWRAIYGEAGQENRTDIKWGGFIDGVDEFDPRFFNISPREAELMDPQHRLLLLHTWKAIEDAGYAPSSLAGSNTGVFVGTGLSDYVRLLAQAGVGIDGFTAIGTVPSVGPNRVSYLLDLRGPSEPIETSCSSSLVALHRAVDAIRGGQCDLAIAGGVNTILTPDLHISCTKAGMLSHEGRCKTFSARADGYVRSEGIGLLVLRKLSAAEAAGDHIYGVILGSAENHGGRANSFTAPNPQAQAELLRRVYVQSNVDPATVSYIEAHGTGTELGDPIEIDALKTAFGDLYARSGATPVAGHCGIGSVKSNIGHLELAAGVAGVIKVLLQLQHQTLVPSIHTDTINPYIQLDGSPFYIVRETSEWAPRRDADGAVLPRRAGVSSFGFGGVNAHVVLEEYRPRPDHRLSMVGVRPQSHLRVVVLSARDEERLREQVVGLLTAMRLRVFGHDELGDVAYTLQVGRDAMDARFGCIVSSVAELEEKLQAFLDGEDGAGMYRGDARRNQDVLSVLGTDDGFHAIVERWIEQDRPDKLLELWVKGLTVAWERLYGAAKPRRVSLPSYPFARESYWVPQTARPRGELAGVARLHPLVHENTSDLTEQRYRATFTGQEFFLADHRVDGRRWLPAVAYMEMAREAVARAIGRPEADAAADEVLALRDVVWVRPVSVGSDPVELSAALSAEDNGTVSFEIYGRSGDAPETEVVYARGVASVGPRGAAPRLDVAALALRHAAGSIPAETCYAAFDAMGIAFGPGHRGLRSVHVDGDMAIAQVSLPAAVAREPFLLHPAVMDAALQATVGFSIAAGATHGPSDRALPFALDALEIHGPTPAAGWVVAHRVGVADDATGVASYDIELCDGDGLVCAALRGLSTRRAVTEAIVPEPETAVAIDRDDLHRAVEAALTAIAARLLKLPADHFRPSAQFHDLGFDSILLIAFADQLKGELGLDVTPPLFFQHPTLERFTRYLIERHRDALAAHFAPRTSGGALVMRAEEPSSERRVRRTRARAVATGATAEPIAIVGISGRFPMARDVDELWANLTASRDCIEEIPPQRWDWRDVWGDPGLENKTNVKWGGFIEGVDEFDAQFFNIPPREADLMDPQQRLLLQHVWKAVEDAGYAPSSLAGSNTGVFVATGLSDYARIVAQSQVGLDGHTAMGSAASSVGPNRISYLLDLHGPSEPIETTCSSSLVAVHRAVNAMRSGQCDMALVGGVNTILTPDLHISCTKAGMLSADGRCKTFSRGANGFVRSEGVGILMLKKLSDAEAAGDHIYGMILGTAENHGGRANSFTSPNPQAQAELLRRAYLQAAVDPSSVTYIEAHGTGTELGDPIEIEALKTAFGDLYERRGMTPVTGHCGLGTVKSNIGHLELAAGVAGMIKVLLQMKHRTLVPTLHCSDVNPYIQLENSPFYLVREAREWTARHAADGSTLPRRAGVSSFGFGGVNAHVVLEEYRPRVARRQPAQEPRPAIVVLSARDQERLREQAEALLAAIRTRTFNDSDLTGIAYTLQVGREAMDARFGCLVHTIGELEQQLQAFLDAPPSRAQDRAAAEAVRQLTANEEFRGVIDRWIEQGRADKLLELWLSGVQVDWERLYRTVYKDAKPGRVALPTYPFARKRCWVSAQGKAPAAPAVPQAGEVLGYPFNTVVTGEEFFLSDHRVHDRKVLPAVVYLEMARAAAERAGTSIVHRGMAQPGVTLHGVVWARPFFVDAAGARLQMRLTAEGGGELKFQLCGDGNVVYGQGRASAAVSGTIEMLDVAGIRARCTQQRYAAEDCYRAFDALGYHYGPAHQGIVELHVGGDELLAQLRLPETVADTLHDFVLHPSIGDSAAQSIIGFLLADRCGPDEPIRAALPFELQTAEIFRPCAAEMWAWIRRDGETYDMDLCDASGRVSTRLRGWTMRALDDSAARTAPQPAEAVSDMAGMMWTPVWDVATVERQDAPAGPLLIAGGTEEQRASIERLYPGAKRLDLDGGRSVESIRGQLAAAGAIGHLVWIVPPHVPAGVPAGVGDETLITARHDGVLAGFRLIHALLGEGYGVQPLTWSVLTTDTQAVRATDAASPAHATVHGLVGSAAKELPGWNVRLLDLPGSGEWPWSELFTIRPEPHGNALVYRDDRWYRQQLLPYRPAGAPEAVGRDGEVYVIIGGAGGIGAAWSEALLRRAKVQLVWIGRRAQDPALDERLAQLAKLGPTPLYIAADATSRAALESARETILSRFGRIDGIVHGAFVLQDRMLANMTEDDFIAGLAPKVDVCVRLAQVFAQDAPRFVLFFSSLNALAKSPGQSNYVAGCTFKDAFAQRLAAEWPSSRVRVINWGYWGSVGAVATERYRALMARRGFGSIEAADAVVVLDRLLSGPVAQLAYAKTTAPAAIDGVTISSDEWVTHFDERLPSCVAALELPQPDAAELASLRSAAAAGEELDASLTDLLWAQLQSMRVFTPQGASLKEMQARGGVTGRYTRWLEHSLALLASRGYLVRSGDAWSMAPAAPADAGAAWQAWERRKAQWLEDADWSAQVQLAETALRALPDVLTGRGATTDILFADLFGESSVVGRVTRSGAPIRFCNRVLADLAGAYAAERARRDPASRLRILEIGAGTGSTTEVLLEALAPHAGSVQEYTYTDISPAFVTIAGKWLRSQPPYLKFGTFDVERPAAEQGLAAGSYDLVVASNALHATKEIGATLRNAKSLLAANGLLLLNEPTVNSVFNHLTFGLLDGWWLFTDAELRIAGGPALRSETWAAALGQEGYRSIRFPAAPAHGLGRQIVVAESDGVIRQHSAAPLVAVAPQRPAVTEEAPRSAVVPASPVDVPTSPAEIMTRPREVAVEYLMADLRLRVAKALGADPMTLVPEPQSFADALLGEFGMDSLSSNDLRNVLRQELGVDIPVQRLIGDPVRNIVDAIYDQMLLRHITTNVAGGEEEEHRETFVF